MKTKGHRNPFLVFILVFLAGCAMGPNYKRPAVKTPSDYRFATVQATNSLGDLPWWEVFKDPDLRELIREALTNNYDIKQAAARVEEARQFVTVARSAFFPQVGYNGEIGRGKNPLVSTPLPQQESTENLVLATVNAVWEIDFWGRIRRLTEAARAQYLATDEARRGVTISVISDVAQSWYQLLALDEELAIAKRASNSFGDSLRIFSERLQGGVASRLETSSAEALQASAAAAVPRLEQQIALQENQLSVLLGLPPKPIERGNLSITNLPETEVPAGLPSALLERRPDIRAAEQQLRSANAQIGVAIADFFPQLSLTALFGQVSPEASAFTSGGANAWSIAANAAGPIFQGGRLASQYRQSKAAWEQAKLQYQYTVLNALQEVSDSLIARQKLAEAQVQQARAVTAYQQAVDVATQRYRDGQSSYYEVLQEQQQLFPAENTLVETDLARQLALIQLYQALGGGWTSSREGERHREP